MCFSLYKNSYAENYIPQLISFSHKYITPHSQAPLGNALLFTSLKAGGRFFFGSFLKCQKKE